VFVFARSADPTKEVRYRAVSRICIVPVEIFTQCAPFRPFTHGRELCINKKIKQTPSRLTKNFGYTPKLKGGSVWFGAWEGGGGRQPYWEQYTVCAAFYGHRITIVVN
jgi:hypothetical protein